MRIALTGGIACGKSRVAQFLNELGIETIDADDVVHDLLPDPAERKRIAAEVFADPEKRRALEARLHPIVKARIAAFLGRTGDERRETREVVHLQPPASHHPPVLRLAIIPLLFETHWDADYDIIGCVRASRDAQVARMIATRGYTREEAEARLAAQMPVEEKVRQSHYVIDNDGSVAELKAKVAAFADWLKNEVKRKEVDYGR